jgi:hypothetical protein
MIYSMRLETNPRLWVVHALIAARNWSTRIVRREGERKRERRRRRNGMGNERKKRGIKTVRTHHVLD